MKKKCLIKLFFYCIFSIHFSLFAQGNLPRYFLSFDKTKIHYEVIGSGKPILLIHGFTGTGSDWKRKPIYDSLLSNGYKIIFVDLRGNGMSDKPQNSSAYANNAEAKDLVGLMKFLKIRSYDALGYSRGSIILASLLVMDKNCRTAVIGGMGADFTNPLWPRRIAFYNALMNDTVQGFEGFRKYISEKGLDPRVLASQQKEQPSISKEQLSRLKQKVLIICGNADKDNGSGLELHALIPRSTYVEVVGDHNSSWGTIEFAGKVLEFFKGVN